MLLAKNNSKILWDVVREIAGKTKSKDEQVYVYRSDMSRHKIENDWPFFMEAWKADIYKKYQECHWNFGMVLKKKWD